jgi:hypothetical protein
MEIRRRGCRRAADIRLAMVVLELFITGRTIDVGFEATLPPTLRPVGGWTSHLDLLRGARFAQQVGLPGSQVIRTGARSFSNRKNFCPSDLFWVKTCCTKTTNSYNYGQVEPAKVMHQLSTINS